MSRQIVLAIDAIAWQAAPAAQRDAVMGMIGSSGGGDTIAPVIWNDAEGKPWMVSAYWREHVVALTDEQIAALQEAARSILFTIRLYVAGVDDAALFCGTLGLRPVESLL